MPGVDRQRPGGERIDQIGQREIDRHALRARRGERIDRDPHDLARRGQRIQPDQFGADLPGLARRGQFAGAQFQDGARIGQPHRPRVMPHPRAGDARDLRGEIGPDRQRRLADRIDEAHRIRQPPAFRRAPSASANSGERRIDAFIAIEPRRLQHARLHRRGGIRERGQAIVETLGGGVRS